MSFYQTYRPKKIAELDLSAVREALLQTLSSGKIAHAYLFVGPRGSGKTSTARILAQVVNCKKNIEKSEKLSEPCGVCDFCQSIGRGSSVDVIEIDAASNGLVDDIRDLRDKVRLAPTQLSKKIYIIDEVHMVSTAGFNALLKTLEEPPAHALFMLCTTELQKVPETIVSRCAKINFTKGTEEELVRSLRKAVEGEGLEVDDQVLAEIAEVTDGSFREGHKILEQLSSYGKKITREALIKVTGAANKETVKKLLRASLEADFEKVMEIFVKLDEVGTKANVLLQTLLILAKEEMEKMIRKGEGYQKVVLLIDELIKAADKIKYSPLPMLPIEVALLSVGYKEGGGSPKVQLPAQTSETERKDVVIKSSPKELKEQAILSEKVNEIVQSNMVQSLTMGDLNLEKIKSNWDELVNSMAKNNGSLAGMLRLVSPVEMSGKSIILAVSSRFQQDMLEREAKRRLIEEHMAKVWGPVTFRCVLSEKPVRPVSAEDENVEVVGVGGDMVGGVMSVAEKIFGE